jgi:hypothetical protein
MSLKDKLNNVESTKNEELTLLAPSTSVPTLGKHHDSLGKDSEIFEWHKFLTKKLENVLDDNLYLEMDLVDKALSNIILNFDMSTNYIVKTSTANAAKRLTKLAEFYCTVIRNQESHSNLKAHNIDIVLNPTNTKVSLVIDGLKKYSSPFYYQLQKAIEHSQEEIVLRLMNVDVGQVIQMIVKHGTKKENIKFINNFKGRQREL